ncbi:MAG: FtsX-like permease family protein [Christensenellaceae bacterium]|nr:FtsX-like permease family protein [Christensenellaceae bacterium]
MSIIALIALRSLKKNKSRTTATAVGIFLSILLMTAIIVLVMSLLSSLIVTTIASKGDWHFFTWNIPSEQVNFVLETGKVQETATIYNVGYAAIVNPSNERKPYIHHSAVSMSIFQMLPIILINGRLPQNPNEVLLPTHFANDYKDIKIGDSIVLSFGKRCSIAGDELSQNSNYMGTSNEGIEQLGESKIYYIVGITEEINFIENDFSPGYTILSLDTNAGFDNKVVYYRLNNPKANFYAVTSIVSETNIAYNNDLLSVQGIVGKENLRGSIVAMAVVLMLIITVASSSLISNSFMISVSERIKQYALLCSIGATKKQIIQTVVYEALFLSTFLIPLGLACGIGCVALSLSSIGKLVSASSYLNLVFKLNVNALAVASIVIFGVSLILLSAFLPALQSVKKHIIATIRQNDEIKIRKEKALKPKKEKSIEAELVGKNFQRFNKKYRYVIFSLVCSMVLFVATSSYCSYATIWINESMELLDYDIVCNTYYDVYKSINNVYLPLSEIVGVSDSGWFSSVDAGWIVFDNSALTDSASQYYSERNEAKETIQYVFVDDLRFISLMTKLHKDVSKFMNKNEMRAIILANIDAIRISGNDYTTETIDVFIDKTVSFDINYMNNDNRQEYYSNPDADFLDYSKRISITADVISRKNLSVELSNLSQASGIYAIIPLTMLDAFADDIPQMVQMFFKAQNHKTVFNRMEKFLTSNNVDAFLDDVTIGYEMQQNTIAMVNIFSKVFIIVVSMVMILSVLNTTLASVLIRKRDFVILRSIGMSIRSFVKTMLYEYSLYGAVSIILGLSLSFLISWILKFSFSASMKFILPINNIVIALLSIIFILAASMTYAIYKILTDNIIDSLKTEIT